MTRGDLGGSRLAELLIAELVGRDLGPLSAIEVPGLDHPTLVQCEVGDEYDLEIDGRLAGRVTVVSAAVEVRRTPGGPTVRVEEGATVKAAVDVVAGWVT